MVEREALQYGSRLGDLEISQDRISVERYKII